MTKNDRPAFGFEVLKQDGAARRGRVTSGFGVIDTPAFMPVGTAAVSYTHLTLPTSPKV